MDVVEPKSPRTPMSDKAASSAERTVELSGTLRLEDSGILQRLALLEQKVQVLDTDSHKGLAAWTLDVLKALLPGIVLAIVGFVLNDTVNQALKEHELQIAAIKDMQTLSADLQRANITRDEASAGATQLASYGKYAVPFFINVEEVGNEYGALGAVEGLQMVARSEPQVVCTQVGAVIRNRTGLYHWQSHLAALQLIAQIPCPTARADVKAYHSGLASPAVLATWLAGSAPDQAEFDKVRDAAQKAAANLDRSAAPKSFWGWFRSGH